ncbi:hypothetical protein GCM10025774_04720 [Microbacterium kyungheense]
MVGVTCPTPGKHPHESNASATSAAATSIRRRGGYLRIYLCACGAYHLTHKRRADLGR